MSAHSVHMNIARVGLLLAATVLPATALAQQVNYDFDRDADFGKYKTFAYKVCMRIENPLVDKRIVTALENTLGRAGFTRAEGDADVNITYHSSTTEDIAIDTTTWGYGYGPGWQWGHGGYGYGGYGYGGGPISTTTTIRKYTRGTLVVDIWDARTKQLVWRGTASDSVSDDPEKNDKKVLKALGKLFKKYPPEKKG
ncbi:MAG TPA: DUF4136 domain-containing protein [Vicinamibacterales bacterium]|nr:DUF4136 domain-containing protein [Vicinamibacterales bacterium]